MEKMICQGNPIWFCESTKLVLTIILLILFKKYKLDHGFHQKKSCCDVMSFNIKDIP